MVSTFYPYSIIPLLLLTSCELVLVVDDVSQSLRFTFNLKTNQNRTIFEESF